MSETVGMCMTGPAIAEQLRALRPPARVTVRDETKPWISAAKRRKRAKVLREGTQTAPPQRITVTWHRSSESTI